MMRLIQKCERYSRLFLVLACFGMLALVGLVDYVTGFGISFSVFYLLAVGFATWFIGRNFGMVMSVLSVGTWIIGDIAAGARYTTSFIPIWNAAILLAFYCIVVWLLASLRSLTRELEDRVRQRTVALTQEMAERERLEKEILEVSEREQRRIGHDLHDSLGQHLTGVALAGQVLEGKLATRGLPEAADANKVVELVEEGIALSRKLAQGLHPIGMEAEGLMQALEELAATSSELFKISCRFECDSPVLIHETAISGHLYRIAQEAISNAIKHGKARNVIIQLEPFDDGTTLRVKDDGVGLPEVPPRNAGVGLRIMAHRASMIGATFKACRGDSGGTVVSCVLRHKSNLKKGSRD